MRACSPRRSPRCVRPRPGCCATWSSTGPAAGRCWRDWAWRSPPRSRKRAHVVLGKCLSGGLGAYRAARNARIGDQARFAAFVAGLTEALAEPHQQALVTDALSPLQERALRLAGEGDG